MINFRLVSDTPAGFTPFRANPDDAGIDLPFQHDVLIEPGNCVYWTGIYVALPQAYMGLVTGRSSAFKLGLVVNPGIIDAGYRGEIGIQVNNLSNEQQKLEAGARLVQLIPIRLGAPMSFDAVAVPAHSDAQDAVQSFGEGRGGGFGSSGGLG